MDKFILHSEFEPTGDQPRAIRELVDGFKKGNQFETLLGVTGSGKTFTMANVIAQLNKPTLIIAHNKTLAAQLYSEFKEFFPENAVEYFVSYYDYYQPEAYVPSTDTYIEKDSSINDEIDKLRHSATAALIERKDVIVISSVSCIYGIGSPDKIERAVKEIEAECDAQVAYFKENDKLLEAQRISERTHFDMEMLKETGFCSGIENYSRPLAGLEPGATPNTLLEFFKDDFLMIIDESHITVPQIRGMYAGDRSRKQTLVDFGFRLPSAMDNRPLRFDEFEDKLDQVMFVSATPSDYEAEHELLRTEQLIRPTGLLDPSIEVKPVEGQVDDLLSEVNKEVEKGNKVLVTTLTKRMAEDLTDYLRDQGVKVKYLHSDIDTLERTEIVRDLRLGVFDVLVGINLLREGLDIPEITLVAILDADKEGFLRSETSLVQTIGRAARNSDGRVIMYADTITGSMKAAIDETNRRRQIQDAYNKEHGITPTTIKKAIRDLITTGTDEVIDALNAHRNEKDIESMSKKELQAEIKKYTKKMETAAAELNFEMAAEYRDHLKELKVTLRDYDL